MEEKVLEVITKYNLIKSGDSIVVGVSGGPDSICLINILKNLQSILGVKLFVAHINHMIREDATDDENFVVSYCKKNQIECFVKRENVILKAKNEKIGTEEAGRNLRYQFFEEVLKKTHSNKIAIAHTANDNAETVLMNIIRGSGMLGIKGIEPKRDEKIIRPLIELKREEIEEYCEKNKLEPRIDYTNKENIYTRNKVRNLLIPYIKENFNPNIISSLNKLSQIAREENEYINNEVLHVYKKVVEIEEKDKIIIDLKSFNMQETVIKKGIVLYTINKILGTTKGIEKVHIEDIIKLCGNNIGNKMLSPNKNIKINLKKGKIFFCSSR